MACVDGIPRSELCRKRAQVLASAPNVRRKPRATAGLAGLVAEDYYGSHAAGAA
jgi:hypothetical protein